MAAAVSQPSAQKDDTQMLYTARNKIHTRMSKV